jgi:predicted transcriptional regulator
MKRPVNLRLDENIIVTLNQLAKELNTTKTEVIESALKLFSKTKQKERNQLLEFAGILKNNEANKMLNDIQTNKNSKDFEITL